MRTRSTARAHETRPPSPPPSPLSELTASPEPERINKHLHSGGERGAPEMDTGNDAPPPMPVKKAAPAPKKKKMPAKKTAKTTSSPEPEHVKKHLDSGGGEPGAPEMAAAPSSTTATKRKAPAKKVAPATAKVSTKRNKATESPEPEPESEEPLGSPSESFNKHLDSGGGEPGAPEMDAAPPSTPVTKRKSPAAAKVSATKAAETAAYTSGPAKESATAPINARTAHGAAARAMPLPSASSTHTPPGLVQQQVGPTKGNPDGIKEKERSSAHEEQVHDAQSESDEDDSSGSKDNYSPTTDEDEEAGSDEVEDVGPDAEEQAGSDEDDAAGSDAEEQAGFDEDDAAGSDAEEQAGSDEDDAAGSDAEEQAGSDEDEDEPTTSPPSPSHGRHEPRASSEREELWSNKETEQARHQRNTERSDSRYQPAELKAVLQSRRPVHTFKDWTPPPTSLGVQDRGDDPVREQYHPRRPVPTFKNWVPPPTSLFIYDRSVDPRPMATEQSPPQTIERDPPQTIEREVFREVEVAVDNPEEGWTAQTPRQWWVFDNNAQRNVVQHVVYTPEMLPRMASSSPKSGVTQTVIFKIPRLTLAHLKLERDAEIRLKGTQSFTRTFVVMEGLMEIVVGANSKGADKRGAPLAVFKIPLDVDIKITNVGQRPLVLHYIATHCR